VVRRPIHFTSQSVASVVAAAALCFIAVKPEVVFRRNPCRHLLFSRFDLVLESTCNTATYLPLRAHRRRRRNFIPVVAALLGLLVTTVVGAAGAAGIVVGTLRRGRRRQLSSMMLRPTLHIIDDKGLVAVVVVFASLRCRRYVVA
jgi:hypothetical protein